MVPTIRQTPVSSPIKDNKPENKINRVPTPIRPLQLKDWLSGYSAEETNFLVEGFSNGFLVPYHGPSLDRVTTNHSSALNNPTAVDQKIQKELSLGRIAGPFQDVPLPGLVISPIGLVPKKDPGSFRLIHDLSHPKKQSINEGIPKAYTSVQYQSLDDVVQCILATGKGTLIGKCDFKDAYRMCPIHPDHYHLLGFSWRGKHYYDRCLPMGASFSCQLFERFSNAIHWIMQNKHHVKYLSHILDDFIFFGPPSSDQCEKDMTKFLSLAQAINIPIKEEKTVWPATEAIVHGILVDTINMELKLPQDKLDKARSQLLDLKGRRKVRLRTLQSVIGLLNFACHVIVPGRPFLRRLINLTTKVANPFHHIRLTRESRADISAWLSFLHHFNGKSMFLDHIWQSSRKLQLHTDAAGGRGYAAVFGREWFYGGWPVEWKCFNIAILELYPIVAAVGLWAKKLQNKCVLFHTDNIAVVYVINKQTSQDQNIMKLVRKLVMTCMQHNILFQAIHIAGVKNYVADALSRFQLARARSLQPHLARVPITLPENLLPSNMMSNNF